MAKIKKIVQNRQQEQRQVEEDTALLLKEDNFRKQPKGQLPPAQWPENLSQINVMERIVLTSSDEDSNNNEGMAAAATMMMMTPQRNNRRQKQQSNRDKAQDKEL